MEYGIFDYFFPPLFFLCNAFIFLWKQEKSHLSPKWKNKTSQNPSQSHIFHLPKVQHSSLFAKLCFPPGLIHSCCFYCHWTLASLLFASQASAQCGGGANLCSSELPSDWLRERPRRKWSLERPQQEGNMESWSCSVLAVITLCSEWHKQPRKWSENGWDNDVQCRTLPGEGHQSICSFVCDGEQVTSVRPFPEWGSRATGGRLAPC